MADTVMTPRYLVGDKGLASLIITTAQYETFPAPTDGFRATFTGAPFIISVWDNVSASGTVKINHVANSTGRETIQKSISLSADDNIVFGPFLHKEGWGDYVRLEATTSYIAALIVLPLVTLR